MTIVLIDFQSTSMKLSRKDSISVANMGSISAASSRNCGKRTTARDSSLPIAEKELYSSGTTMKSTIAITPSTTSMVRIRLSTRFILRSLRFGVSLGLPNSLFSKKRMGTLSTNAMQPPIRKGAVSPAT